MNPPFRNVGIVKKKGNDMTQLVFFLSLFMVYEINMSIILVMHIFFFKLCVDMVHS